MPAENSARLIPGGLHTDARGTVAFVNDFDFQGVQRFYTIRPRQEGQVRGWIGHQREHKWFTCVQGQVLIAVVRPDCWEKPARDLPVQSYTLSDPRPAVLHVPAGHATASVSLSENVVLIVFSSGRLPVASQDDYRFAPDYWPISEGERP